MPDPEISTSIRPAGATWRRPAYAWTFLIAVMVLIGFATNWFTVPIVLGSLTVVTPSLAAMLLGGATIPALVLIFQLPASSSSWQGRIGRWLLRALAMLATLLVWALIGILWVVGLVSPWSVHVLTPSGPAGCRVLVRETSFLWAGTGIVYVLPAGHVLAKPVSGYDADDGLEPVSEGMYDLSWQGTQGALNVRGTPDDPVWPTKHFVSCA